MGVVDDGHPRPTLDRRQRKRMQQLTGSLDLDRSFVGGQPRQVGVPARQGQRSRAGWVFRSTGQHLGRQGAGQSRLAHAGWTGEQMALGQASLPNG